MVETTSIGARPPITGVVWDSPSMLWAALVSGDFLGLYPTEKDAAAVVAKATTVLPMEVPA